VQPIRKVGPKAAAEIIVNVALPYACYTTLHAQFGDVRALLVAASPPVIWSLIEFVRKRRADVLSLLVLLGIALSLVAFIESGSARFLLLRENLATGAIGLIFLGSAAIGKPLMYQLARATAARGSPAASSEIEQLKDNVYFRRAMTRMTLVWGFGLLAAMALAIFLVFVLPIGSYLLVAPFLHWGIAGALALWTAWYARRARRLGAERLARRLEAEARTLKAES
jgi:hypothetical protein